MTDIYYFSGSGNSLAVATDLGEGLQARVRAMTRYPEGLRAGNELDAVGFVFPSHDFQAPTFVQDWVRHAEGLSSKYVFAVMTYGVSAGSGLTRFAALLREQDATLDAGFAVMMPHNGIGSALQPAETRERLLRSWRLRRRSIIEVIAARKKARLQSSPAVLGFMRRKSWKMLPGLFRFAGVMMREGEQGLAYRADDSCIGCRICARLCPVGNIRMTGQRPEWGPNCVNCFACLHWCPQEAAHLSAHDLCIDHAYHHPDVRLKQMLDQAAT